MRKSLVLVVSALVIEVFAVASDPAPIPGTQPAWAPAPPSPAPGQPVVLPAPGSATALTGPAAQAAVNGPRIQFDSMVFDFGKAMSGELVKHTYYFTNTGVQELVLSNVQPQCGCTAAGQWTHVVKPGETGEIPIQFNTANYNMPVTKIVTVTSNDKTQPLLPLQLKGTVWKPIDVSPQVLVLSLRSEAPYSSGVVRITNSLDAPLWLSLPECNNQVFGAELKTNFAGREYLVVISNKTVLPPGGIQGQVTLKTSVASLPVISILAYANMQAAVTISPPQLMLPPPPIPTNQLVRYVTLINNTTNPLTLSETSINAKDVQVTTQTLQAGKYFTITLTFPPDFEAQPGQPVFFSTRTSCPQFELIKVPIYQTPRPPVAQANTAPTPPPTAPAPGPILKRPTPPGTRPIQPIVTASVTPPPVRLPAPPPAPATLQGTAPAVPPLPPSQ